MFAHLGRRVRLRADQLQAASPRDGADPRRLRRVAGVRVAEDRRGAGTGHRGADRGDRLRRRTRAGSAPRRRHRRGTDPSTLAWLFYTSGTTGRSKGAMLSHRNLMAMTVSHLADFDAPDENCSLVHGAPMSHGSGLYVAAVRAARRPPGDARRRARSNPTSSSTCATTTRAAAPSSRRPWCSAWCRPDAACPRNLQDGGLRRRPDVRRKPEEGDGGVRPDLRPALRPG